jgi:hypothetical protein
MLATAVRIDRAVERQVGRLVESQDAAAGLGLHHGFRPRLVDSIRPAVVKGLVPMRLEAAAAIAGRTAPLDGAAFVDAGFTHLKSLRQYTTAPVSGSKSNREDIPAQAGIL